MHPPPNPCSVAQSMRDYEGEGSKHVSTVVVLHAVFASVRSGFCTKPVAFGIASHAKWTMPLSGQILPFRQPPK